MLRGFLYALPLSLLMWAGIGYGAVTLRDMLNDARYWPPKCVGNVCFLTGLGGIVSVWEAYVDDNPGATFIVKGLCASACEIAFRRAKLNDENIISAPGSKLVPHKIGRVVYK